MASNKRKSHVQEYRDYVARKEGATVTDVWKEHLMRPFTTMPRIAAWYVEKPSRILDSLKESAKTAATIGEIATIIKGVTNSPHWWKLPDGSMANPPAANEQRPAGPNQMSPIQAIRGDVEYEKVSNMQTAGLGHMTCLNIRLCDVYDNKPFNLLVEKYYEKIRNVLRSNLPYQVVEVKDYLIREMSLYARLLATVRKLNYRTFVDPTVPEFQQVWRTMVSNPKTLGLVDLMKAPLLDDANIADSIAMYPMLQQEVEVATLLPKYSELIAWLTAPVYCDQNSTNRQYYWVHLSEVPIYEYEHQAATAFVDAEQISSVRELIDEYQQLHSRYGMVRADLRKVGLAARIELPPIDNPTPRLVHDPEFFSFVENAYCMSSNLFKMVANYSIPDYVRLDYLPSCYGDKSQMNGTSLGVSNFVGSNGHVKPIINLISQSFFFAGGGTFAPSAFQGSVAAGEKVVAREMRYEKDPITAFNMTSWMQQRFSYDDITGLQKNIALDIPHIIDREISDDSPVSMQISLTDTGDYADANFIDRLLMSQDSDRFSDFDTLVDRFSSVSGAEEHLKNRKGVYIANYRWRHQSSDATYWGSILWTTSDTNWYAAEKGGEMNGEILFISNIPGFQGWGNLPNVKATKINKNAIVLKPTSFTWSAQRAGSGLVGTILAPNPYVSGIRLDTVSITPGIDLEINAGLSGNTISYTPWAPLTAWLTTMFDYTIPVFSGSYLELWPGTNSSDKLKVDSYAYLCKTGHVTAWTTFTEITTSAEMQQIALFSET